MNFMCPEKRLAKLSFLTVLITLVLVFPALSQSKKTTASKKAVIKKTVKPAKDARKDSRTAKVTTKSSKKDTKNDRASAKGKSSVKGKTTAKTDTRKNSSKEELTAKTNSRDKNAKSAKKDPKKAAETRRLEEARRRAEEERRAAALAEKRRREQIAREARERKLAFERGLHTETTENIANDVTDGEDLQVRAAAVDALGSRAGTVVVMEAQTGKILTIVNQDWAIRNSFKPCSTIKLVTGVAGLNEKVINDEGGIGESTSGLKLDAALARSNNGYFQRVGSNLGSSKMVGYAKELGLGEPTGINAEGETAGRVPHGNNNARIYSHGDDFEVTPLQLAVLASALSNGGKKVVPHIPQTRQEKANYRGQSVDRLDLPQHSYEGVLTGMIGAAEYGTAHRGVDASMGVAGKTGSCIEKGSWVGLFTSVAPVEDPKYSVVVITRGQGERGKYAAAVAGKVYQALRNRITRNPNSDLARRLAKPVTDAQTAKNIADEDEDDMEETDAIDGARPPIIVGTQSPNVQSAPKRLIQKTTQSKPVTPSKIIIEYDRSGNGQTRPRVVKIN